MGVRVLAVLNQKGGVGKTTTAINLACSLARNNSKVLLVDLDPQSNATIGLGVAPADVKRGLFELLTRETIRTRHILRETMDPNLFLLAATPNLARVESDLWGRVGREMILREKLHPLLEGFQFAVLDCPPSMGLLSLNAITSATELIIPVQTQFFAVKGLSQLINTLATVKKKLGHAVPFRGLATLHDPGARLNRMILEDIRVFFKNRFFQTVINWDIRLAEAAGLGQPILHCFPDSQACQEYQQLALELMGQHAWSV